jgi:soluble lytic murein transglycosylase-like protein
MLAIGVVIAVVILGGVTLIQRATITPLKPETASVSSPWIPQTVKHWNPIIEEMGKKYNVDPTAIAILMTMESGGYSKAKSEAGAVGLMQITPPTAGDIAKKYLKKPVTKYNLLDPRTSIEFGAAYMAYLRDEFGDRSQGPSWGYTMELVAAAYNGGPGTAGKFYRGEGMTDTQTVVYSRDALNMWRERGAQDSPTFDRWQERGGSNLLDLAKSQS